MVVQRLCFIGDSFVNGTGDPDCLGWVGRVCARACRDGHDLTVYNLGIRGNTSADIRQRWWQEVERRISPTVDNRMVFSFGTNDTTIENGQRRVPLAESIEHSRQILTQAKQHYPTLMISSLPIADPEQNLRSAELNSSLADLCQSLGIPFLDAFSQLINSDVWMSEVAKVDDAHPQAGGYAKLADMIQQWSAWQDWLSCVARSGA